VSKFDRSATSLNPLHGACRAGNIDLVRLLLEKYSTTIDSLGSWHHTALQAVSLGNHIDIVKLLLLMGADVSILEGKYGSPLQAASASGNLDIVDVLLQERADVNSRGGKFGSALQAAAAGKHYNIIDSLLQLGAIVNT
jgi:ankyrin repeat protein